MKSCLGFFPSILHLGKVDVCSEMSSKKHATHLSPGSWGIRIVFSVSFECPHSSERGFLLHVDHSLGCESFPVETLFFNAPLWFQQHGL